MDRLLGRREECAALDQLVAGVLEGASRVLVVRGEPGVGKSALLGYLSRRIAGETARGGNWRVVSAAGVQSSLIELDPDVVALQILMAHQPQNDLTPEPIVLAAEAVHRPEIG